MTKSVPPSGSLPRAPVHLLQEAVIRAPVERVWGSLVDLSQWPMWHPGISRLGVEGELEVGTRFHWRMNGMHLHGRVLELEAPVRARWEVRGMGLAGVQLWKLESAKGVTRVTMEEAVGGWVPFLMRGTVGKTIRLSREGWMEALRRVCETTPTDLASPAQG
ncbi:MAG: SRPBCC family protein [Gemmatimonadota bacterium]